MSESKQEQRTSRGMSKGITIMVVAAALGVAGITAARADTTGSTVTVCAQKSSGQMRYARNGVCRQTEIKLLLGATGATGATGPSGPTSPVTINSQTGSTYTLVLADAGKFITASSISAISISIPTNATVAFPVGTRIDLGQVGSSGLQIAPSTGVTLNGGTVSRSFDSGSYQYGVLLKIGTDAWVLLLPVPNA